MGATEHQQAAIARIDVQEDGVTTSRGTGFLVSDDGLLLTAAHVVFDFDAPGKPPRAGTILLFFDTQGARPRFVAAQAIVDQDVDADWALLRCTPPADTEPIQLTMMPPAQGAAWATFGYPFGVVNGGGYGGTVANRYQNTLELVSTDPNKLPAGESARGISGAPCLVDGAAVGVLIAQPNSGKIIAVRACQMLERRPALRRQPLPYESAFTALLDELPPGQLKLLAADLGIDDLTSSALCERTVRAMFELAPHELARSIRAKADDAPMLVARAARWLRLIETLWVRQESASRLGELMSTPPGKMITINTDSIRAGGHYVTRASDARMRLGHWRWVYPLHINEQHLTPAAVLDDVRALLCHKLGGPGVVWKDEQLAKKIAGKKLVIVLVYDPAAQTDLVAQLEQMFPGLRVILLAGESVNAQTATARVDLAYIMPEITPADQDSFEAAQDECDDMRREFRLEELEFV